MKPVYYFREGNQLKKNLIAFILLAALLTALPVVRAVTTEVSTKDISNVKESMDNFTEIQSYENQFTDVPEDAWYASATAKAYSYGLIAGESNKRFKPNGNLSVAETIAIADRIHSIYYTGAQDFAESTPWYKSYVDYALKNGIISKEPTDLGDAITRARFASLLARALPEKMLPAVAEIEDNSIPDVEPRSPYYADFYLLYRAGILVGTDKYGNARPDDNITRAEAASILLRMADRSARQGITLTANVTMYADDGRTLTVPALEIKAYKAVGWHSKPIPVTLYADDGRTLTVFAHEVAIYEAVGWHTQPVPVTVYADDGRTLTVFANEVEAYEAVGWYAQPIPVTMYAPDERSLTVFAHEVEAYEAVGWYRNPVTTIYLGGGSKVIPANEKDDWLKLGWYAKPVVPLPSNFNYTTTLPVISISTGGASISKSSAYTNCTVSVFNVGEDQALSSVTGGIRVRGNSSRSANPPPYRIKFDKKTNLLGLNDGAEMKSWVLLTNVEGAVDDIKNNIAFRLGRALLKPDGNYCSDTKYVHVYLNGSFHGVYLLTEQNQVQKHRVNVYEPEEGYTGTDIGYLVELDNYSEKPYFTMNYDRATVRDINGSTRTFRSHNYSVKSDTYDQAQVDFIAKYTRGVFTIIYEACEKGKYLTFDQDYNVVPSSYQSAKEAVEAVIDTRSFADMYILYEIMHDFDVGGGSFFMCVDFSAESKHPKLTCTAPWDFNWTCMGNISSHFAGAWNVPSAQLGDRSNPWFIVLYKQGWFRDLIKEKWAEVGGGAGMNAYVGEEIAILDANQADINRRNGSAVSRGKAYLNWVTRRINWLDSVWS